MASLGRGAARGATVTVIGQIAKLIVQLLNLVVLSRLLSPTEFGIVAMVLAVVGVSDVIRDFGLSAAAVQAKSLSTEQKSNLFWVNSGLGLMLALAVALCAPLVAVLYNEPALTSVAAAIAPVFFLNGVQTQFQAELGRRLKFFRLSWTDVVAAAVGFLVGFWSAANGYGYWALVWQQLAQAGVLLLLRVLASGWRPGLPTRSASIRPQLKYGGNLMLTQILVYAASNTDRLIIGAKWGAASLGVYSRAFQLLTLPLNQLLAPMTSVALPVLSKIQDERDRFSTYILRAQTVLGHMTVFVFAIAFACAPGIVEIALGPGWDQASGLFRILALGGAFQAIGYPVYWIFLSRGLTGSHFRYSILSRSVVITCVVIGSLFSTLGVAAGYAASLAITWPLSIWWISRITDAPSIQMFRNGLRIVLLGALAGLTGSILIFAILGHQSGAWVPWASIGLATLAAATVYLAAWSVVPAYRSDFSSILATASLLRRRRER